MTNSDPTICELDDIKTDVDALLAVRGQMAALKDTETRLRASIEQKMGDAETGTILGVPVITYKVGAKPRRFNAAAFKAAHPDLHAEFTELGEPSRSFRVVR